MERSEYKALQEADRIVNAPKGRRSTAEEGLTFPGKCSSCFHAFVYRRAEAMYPSVFCQELQRYVPPDITECNRYDKPRTDVSGEIGTLVRQAIFVDPENRSELSKRIPLIGKKEEVLR